MPGPYAGVEYLGFEEYPAALYVVDCSAILALLFVDAFFLCI